MTGTKAQVDSVISVPAFNPETDKRPPSHHYDPMALQDAETLSLGRIPNSPEAQTLTEKVSEAIRPYLGQRAAASANSSRDRGREKRLKEVGHILSGLIRPSFKGRWIAVNEGSGTWFWKTSRILPVKHNAFWTKIKALKEVGLIEYVPGQRFKNNWGNMNGNAARLRASPKLLEWAQECGCSTKTGTADWKLVQPAVITQATTPLVSLRDFPARKNGLTIHSTTDLPVPMSLHGVQHFMKRLTNHLSHFHFSGCCQPVLSARFIGSEHFHGRIYALGSDNYQNGINKEERTLIQINYQPVTEVDISASFLSIALALLNAPEPDNDPYKLPGISPSLRPAIKHWFVVFFGNGKPMDRWPNSTSPNIKDTVDVNTITQAVFQRYPELQNIQQIIPPNIAATVPQELQSWAIGQFLTNVEAKIMRLAMSEHMDEGGTVLPLHDALMVPRHEEGKAWNALMKASQDILGRCLLTNLF